MEKELGQVKNNVEEEKNAEKISEAVFFRLGDSGEYRFQMKEEMPPKFYEKMEERLEYLLGEGNYIIQSRGTRIEIDRGFSGWLDGSKDKPFDLEKVIESLKTALKELALNCQLDIKENTF